MRTGRPTQRVKLSKGEREELESLARRRRSARSVAFRARVILSCAEGLSDTQVSRAIHASQAMIGHWRKRFNERRVAGLFDEPRPGAKRKISDAQVEQVITMTLETTPEGATHWSTREMAKKSGLNAMAISRIWRAFGLQPQRDETFEISRDPLLVEKVRDIVGLYMHPPVNAFVLCVDEKSQIQALSRNQPLLPMSPGQLERRTPQYQRNGTTSLFAALNVATGNVLGRCFQRHRSAEFRKFLDLVYAAVPVELDVHLVLDNYATHKTPMIKRWLAKRPRVHLHFTPTHASWLNQVERWFALLTQRKIKRGVHRSVRELIDAIESFIAHNNEAPKPFVWTKSADQILASIARFATRTQNIHA
jgi:transposase